VLLTVLTYEDGRPSGLLLITSLFDLSLTTVRIFNEAKTNFLGLE
jgi:hypothetical protein